MAMRAGYPVLSGPGMASTGALNRQIYWSWGFERADMLAGRMNSHGIVEIPATGAPGAGMRTSCRPGQQVGDAAEKQRGKTMNSRRSPVPILLLATSLGTLAGCVAAVAQQQPREIIVTPNKLVFYGQAGSSETISTEVTVASSTGGASLTVSAAIETGGGWLSLGTFVSGTTPATLRVFAKVAGLTAGVYTGLIAFDAPGASNNPVVLPVTLTVRDRPTLIVRPTVLNFSGQSDFKFANSQPQTLDVFGEMTGFSVSVVSGWLSVTPTSSVTPAKLSVSVNSSGLAPGSYEGSIVIKSQDGFGWVSVPVTLVMTAVPSIASVSPGSILLQAQFGSHQRVSESVLAYTNGDQFQAIVSSGDQTWLSVETQTPWAGTVDGKTGMILPTPAKLRVYANPTGLPMGNYAGTVTIGRLRDNSPGTSLPVTLRIGSNDLVVSQVADGAGWSTAIILVNTDTEPAPFTIRFYQTSGMPLILPLEGTGRTSELTGTIPTGGATILQTTGSDANLSQGWAQVRAQRSIGGSAIFRQRGASVVSEAAVPAAPALGDRFLLPFDEAEGFSTGLALVNAGANPAVIVVDLRDQNGARIRSGSITLSPRGQQAFMLRTVYPEIANLRGIAEFSASGMSLSAIGLRFSPSGTFTSFQPILPQIASSGIVTRRAAQVADGGGWRTTFVLANAGNQPAPFAAVFKKADGSTLSLPVPGLGRRDEYADIIPVGGVRILETEGTSNPIVDGWAEVVSKGAIAGTVVFAQKGMSNSNSEGTVQLVPPLGEPVVLPFDNTQGFLTALALLNESDSENSLVTVTVRDEFGQRLSTEYLQLQVLTRQVSFLTSLYPSTADRRGTAEFQGVRVSMIGLRFNPMGSFTSMAPVRK